MTDTPLARIQARLLKSGRRCRIIELTGDLEATVEYDGSGTGCECVLVNGRTVLRVPNLSLRLAFLVPHLDFCIPSQAGDIPASIDVAAAGWFRLGTFRLSIAGRSVYEEGDVIRNLPLPAVTPGSAAETLPVPAASEPVEPAGLPIVDGVIDNQQEQ